MLMAMQRLSMLAQMPVGVSKLHARVGESLAWSKGSLGLFGDFLLAVPEKKEKNSAPQAPFGGRKPTGER